jgi:hypothetical protein
MRTVRASDIGVYLYCKRALWYHLKGVPSSNQKELTDGSELHEQHGQGVFISGCLSVLAYILLLSGAILLVIFWLSQVL